ncbi:methyltransferase [Tenacibaculum sp. SG-28]|nr:methyltransferase [Tenacibaculum sp. SG-28]
MLNEASGKHYLDCKDYSISNEEFSLIYYKEYDVLKTTPNPKNIDKYYASEKYISHTDDTKNLVEYLYQKVKKITLKRKLKLINSLKTKEKNILDIGAGTGQFIKICKSNGWMTEGIEPNKKAREIAAEKEIILQNDIHQLKGKKYDIITLWHVLEHIENINEYLDKIKRLLKPNGYLIVAVPNYKSYDATYYGSFWAAYDVPRHIWHFSKKSLKRIFKEINMEIIKIKGMQFDSYYVSILSEQYKQIKLPLCRGVYRGFISNLKARRSKEYSSNIFVVQKKD